MKTKPEENQNQSTATSTTSLTSDQVANLGKSGEPISEQEYAKFVGDLVSPPEGAISRINPLAMNLLHAAIGLASEAGEILDEVKKHIFYGAKLDLDAIHKEQGDMEWYAQLLRNTLGPDRSMVINSNVSKLKKRHPNGFSTASALAKADAIEDKLNAELQAESDEVRKTQAAETLERMREQSPPMPKKGWDSL